MINKSYVTLAVCPICHKETGELLLDRRLREKFDMYTVTPNPCDKCKKKYLLKGVMIMNPENGRLVVIKDSAFRKMFTIPIPKGKIMFAHDDIMDKLQI